MTELLAVSALAFVAGLVSFTAPCTLPLLPGYVSYVSGLEEMDGGSRRTVWAGAGLFVAGFTLTFTAMGATASALGWFLASRGAELNAIAGVLIAGMGLVLIGVLRVPWLQRERRFDLSRIARGEHPHLTLRGELVRPKPRATGEGQEEWGGAPLPSTDLPAARR